MNQFPNNRVNLLRVRFQALRKHGGGSQTATGRSIGQFRVHSGTEPKFRKLPVCPPKEAPREVDFFGLSLFETYPRLVWVKEPDPKPQLTVSANRAGGPAPLTVIADIFEAARAECRDLREVSAAMTEVTSLRTCRVARVSALSQISAIFEAARRESRSLKAISAEYLTGLSR